MRVSSRDIGAAWILAVVLVAVIAVVAPDEASSPTIGQEGIETDGYSACEHTELDHDNPLFAYETEVTEKPLVSSSRPMVSSRMPSSTVRESTEWDDYERRFC